MGNVVFRCQMLTTYWVEMLDLLDLYLEAFPRDADIGRHECNEQDAVSDADDSFIDPEHETWLYDKMHMERNGQRKTEEDTGSIFRGAALFSSIAEGVSPAVVAGAGGRTRRQPRIAGAEANGNKLRLNVLNTENIGKQVHGMKNAVVGGAKEMGNSRFWSSAAAAAAAARGGGGAVPWNVKMKPAGLRPM